MNWARAFFGILIVAVGALLLFDNLDMIDAGEVFSQWWPAAVVVGGVLTFAANPRHWIIPMLLCLAGGWCSFERRESSTRSASSCRRF